MPKRKSEADGQVNGKSQATGGAPSRAHEAIGDDEMGEFEDRWEDDMESDEDVVDANGDEDLEDPEDDEDDGRLRHGIPLRCS